MSTLREVQLCGLEILKSVQRICDNHNLKYYLSCGTLLGAIRHGGFIPWDNDIDIEMPMEDYRKFLKIAPKELPEDLFLQTYRTDPGYNELWAKVRKTGTTSMPLIWKNLDIHWGIGIDIFPLVGIYQAPVLQRLQTKLHRICRTLISKDFILVTDPDAMQSNRTFGLLCSLPRGFRIGLCRVLETFVFHSTAASPRWSMVAERMDYYVKRESYSASVPHPFEDQDFAIPCGYEDELQMLYGDYMTPPPESERNGHEGSLGTKIIYDCTKDYSEYRK